MRKLSLDVYRDTDRDAVIAGIRDLQDVEGTLADTRRPGVEVAELYFDHIQEKLAQKRGALFVARSAESVAGFIGCWIEEEHNVAETEASNIYGYICDAWVAGEFRGRGVFRKLNEKAESYLATFPEVTLMRINALADNVSAIKAYKNAGYRAEEVRFVKRIGL
jgi:ribosomal protein S18 acetylase RimI-like enzyme